MKHLLLTLTLAFTSAASANDGAWKCTNGSRISLNQSFYEITPRSAEIDADHYGTMFTLSLPYISIEFHEVTFLNEADIVLSGKNGNWNFLLKAGEVEIDETTGTLEYWLNGQARKSHNVSCKKVTSIAGQ